MVKFIPEGEIVAVVEPDSDINTVLSGSNNIFNMDVKMKKKLRNCDLESTRITDCISAFFDKSYGTDFQQKVKRQYAMLNTLLAGSVREVTRKYRIKMKLESPYPQEYLKIRPL